MLLRISPINSLFFGTQKGFSPRINDKEIRNSWHPTMDIPLPSTFYGAIASLYLGENPEIFVKYKKDLKNNKQQNERYITIGRILLENEEDGALYINMPLNLLVTDNKEAKEIFNNDLDFNNLTSGENLFVHINAYYDYLFKNKKMKLFKKDDIFNTSYKIGILVEDKNAVDNYLYRIDQINLNKQFEEEYNINFLVEVDIKDMKKFTPKGILKLGGESGFCKYEVINQELKVHKNYSYNFENQELKNKNSVVMLYFFSPAYMNPSIEILIINKVNNVIEVIQENTTYSLKIFTQKPLIVHGFSLSNNTSAIKDKKMYMQRGTVVFVKSEKFINKSLLEIKNIISNIDTGLFINDGSGINIFDVIQDEFYKKYNLEGEEIWHTMLKF